jgi:hypothetical protein
VKNYPPFRCPAVLLSNGLGPGIDGSILSEHDISINFGLCRWAQYVNVLSDATTCDPGSVIAMAGMLGYEACGVPIWVQDVAVKPFRSPRPRVHLRPKPGWGDVRRGDAPAQGPVIGHAGGPLANVPAPSPSFASAAPPPLPPPPPSPGPRPVQSARHRHRGMSAQQ